VTGAVFSQSHTGTDRYDLLQNFTDVSNAGANTPGNMNSSPFGQPVEDPYVVIGRVLWWVFQNALGNWVWQYVRTLRPFETVLQAIFPSNPNPNQDPLLGWRPGNGPVLAPPLGTIPPPPPPFLGVPPSLGPGITLGYPTPLTEPGITLGHPVPVIPTIPTIPRE
jgi:hypothetical protein